MKGHYGEAPVSLGTFDLDGLWTEFMHYLYLPVRIPEDDLNSLPSMIRDPQGPWLRVPEALWFLREPIRQAMDNARAVTTWLTDPYVYVTARRGFATPGNPLNRPGWHCDDFGGTDLNYIWTDRWPTRFLTAKPGVIDLSTDDAESMVQMERLAADAEREQVVPGHPVWFEDGWPVNTLLRLSPYVIHDTPLIPEPGGMRSFFKISVSSHRYNLRGNSHNYALDYRWPMHDRETVRNQPGGNGDYIEEPS